MVAKAATKSGEYFCFHCGKQVQKSDNSCNSCGVTFDRMTDAFRCPRCSNLLPIGAAACPSCKLGFKVRTVSNASKMSDDDRFLVKLIEWGKQSETAPAPGVQTKTMKMQRTPPPPPPEQQATVRQRAIAPKGDKLEQPEKLSEVQIGREVKEAPAIKIKPPQSEPKPAQYLDERIEAVTEELKAAVDRNIDLKEGVEKTVVATDLEKVHDQLDAESQEMQKLADEIIELRTMIKEGMSSQTRPKEEESAEGLSTQGLKKLLEDREKEIKELKSREEELARREEHLNRRIRSYAVKMKELESIKKQMGSGGTTAEAREDEHEPEESEFTAGLVEDEPSAKEEWLKDQAKIKMGLIEIRNQMGGKKSAGAINYYPSQISSDVMEKIEVLEEKLVDAVRERDELHGKLKKAESSMNDVVTLLKILDQLLGRLPPETIDEFSKSKDFKLYERVLDDLNI
ncbi:MAG: hypothetical protein OEV21_00600 [Thermoplasmata archaeon]|nr:hypothetical protein [Thermoplasmata archaeon]